MKKETKISILISTFNKKKFIRKTINSCISQNYKNFEIIIGDTGSTDGTVDILKKIINKKIEILYLKRKFKTSPLNQIYSIKSCLKKSKGKIICLLDGDDLFKKNKLKEINKFFTKNKKINFAQDIPKIKKKNKVFKYNIKRKYDFLFKIWPKFYPTSTFSVKKKELLKYFEKDKNYKYDLLEIDARLFFYANIKERNHKIIKKNLTYYTKNESGISSRFKRFNKEWFKKRLQAHNFIKNFMKYNYPYKTDLFITKYIFNNLKNKS